MQLSQQKLREWINSTTGIWHYKSAMDGQVAEFDFAKLRVMISREVKYGTCVPAGSKDGWYRAVHDELEPMRLISANPKSILPLKWPFQLEKYSKIFRKNVIILFGSKSAGKTAFLINFCKLNMGEFPIAYWNSDMGEEEFRLRLDLAEIDVTTWDTCVELYQRHDNFEDVIKPDHINIVDFLEVYDEFYKIGKPIKEMSKKLDDGILIVAIQKNPNVEVGLGGQRAIEKAKLVLSLDRNLIKIYDVKNWANGLTESPRGKGWTFQLVHGSKFVNIREATPQY